MRTRTQLYSQSAKVAIWERVSLEMIEARGVIWRKGGNGTAFESKMELYISGKNIDNILKNS